MTQCAKNIKETLEKKLNKRISKAYVGIGGMGMHTVTNTIQRTFSEKHVISQDIMEALRAENLQKATSERFILDTVPQEYKVGTQFTNEPVGMLADNLEARYLNVVANSIMSDQIRNCFRADPSYGEGVAEALGLSLREALEAEDPAHPEWDQ